MIIASDEELSGDDDDPDLLNELSEITGDNDEEVAAQLQEPLTPTEVPTQSVSAEPMLPTTTMDTVDLIKSRIGMYKLAEKIAKESGDTSRARSRGRGVKSLESLLKQALVGKTINPDDIPPEVSTNAPNAPRPPAAAEPTPDPVPQETPIVAPIPEPVIQPTEVKSAGVDESKINVLIERQREYKVAALTAKKSGDTSTALQYMKIVRIFDTVLTSARNGEAIDLSDMPPPPSELSSDMLKAVSQAPEPAAAAPAKQENTIQQSTDDTPHEPEPAPKPKPVELPPPEVPKTILEALTQRLQKYQAVEANAKAEGNDRKARQNGRIVKQYLDAIKAHKAGRAVVFEELPVPPGYPPIPTNNQPKPVQAPIRKAPAAPAHPVEPDEPSPEDTSPKRSPMRRQDSRVSGNHSNTSVMNKTIELLLERQKEFKEAALEAKKAGEIEQAKELLKTFKGIDNLLNVARGGLPIDISSVSTSKRTD